MPTQRWASTRAVFTGLPASAAMVAVSSSSRSAHQVRGAVEHRGALVLGEVAGREGLVGRLGGPVHQRRVALRHPADQGAVVGALDLGPLAGLDPLAGDQQLVVRRLDRLVPSSSEPRGPGPCLRSAGKRNFGAACPFRPIRCVSPDKTRRRLAARPCAPADRAPCPRRAASKWVVKGAGFGHGVGMSQYGAYGYAKNGFDYQTILTHYYTGTTIGTVPTETVRVLLLR